ELGVEPGRELRDLQLAILNHDPRLDLPTQPEPEHAPPGIPHPARGERETREFRKTVTALTVSVGVAAADGRRLDPEALRRVMTVAFGLAEAAAERHGGTVEMVAGDTLTVVFGLPRVHEDDGVRAVRAAVEAREALIALAPQLEAERGV